jgi:AraC-like DNA-binding protein
VSRLELAYARPAYGADYGSVFGEPVVFGGPHTQISFPRALLLLPSPEADAAIFEDSVRRCKVQMGDCQQNHNIVQNIEHFLLENPGKLWTLKEIAPLFAFSPRSLIRKLKDADTTYQALRDNALEQQATTSLASMSVEAVALSLGFADTSSFRRTFKRWFGVPPSENPPTGVVRGGH